MNAFDFGNQLADLITGFVYEILNLVFGFVFDLLSGILAGLG